MPSKAPKTSRHLEVERKFDVVESTVSPSFEGIAAVARVEKSPIAIAGRHVLRHARRRIWRATRSPCGAAPAATTPVGT